MHRTQLYLDGELYDRLSSLAKRQGRTMSDLVREALETVYGAGHSESRVSTLEGISGLWRDREDLGDTAEHVRKLRRDTRRRRRRT